MSAEITILRVTPLPCSQTALHQNNRHEDVPRYNGSLHFSMDCAFFQQALPAMWSSEEGFAFRSSYDSVSGT
ncbi:MAG: hypothetical protein OIF55_13180, partial [Amphritea sp.]|nr:hypothetical protein [Amphritea sp.]